MFLDVLKKRNPDFIKAAVVLHQNRRIPSNCYLLDLDRIRENARIIKANADRYNMKVFAMSKQIGREPSAIKALFETGIVDYVTVDIQGARAVVSAGGGIGHAGHLVQIPGGDIPWMIEHSPEFWTVFSYEAAKEISENLPPGKTQRVLARIQAEGDIFYRGHEGGFPAEEILKTAERLASLQGIEFAGITSFPCLLFDNVKKDVYTTPNLKTLARAAGLLEKNGWNNLEINTPGTTSSRVLSLFAEAGSTQIEPGHGFTGTTPLHAVRDLPETPAVLYVSEISHFLGETAYCYGGGLYIDPVFPPYDVQCLCLSAPEEILQRQFHIELPADNAIDYYGMIRSSSPRRGDTVIMGFRPQVFVTRSYVAGISGISRGNPVLEGISFSDGRRVEWP